MCKVCNHVRRTNMKALGAEKEFVMVCPCQAEKQALEKKAKEQQEFMNRVERYRSVGMPEKALRQYTFANDMGYNQQIEIAKNYVNNWETIEKQSLGLIFWGGVGTGKTFLAACIANALLDRGIPVMMTNFTRILNDMADFQNRNQHMDDLNRYPLLILDDLGAEHCSHYNIERIFAVIDARYRSKKPMIPTTNLTMDQMKHSGSLEKNRIFDRIFQRCTPVCVNGQNIRQQLADENMKIARTLLKGEEKPAVSQA